ncbi:MAG: PilZ domain-containing protein [Deltaproteobacteria bacterium]|nr:PilZ domain-containing protein [Deltaproteobacteria bacterium]
MIALIAKIFKRKKRQNQRFIVDNHDLIIYNPNAPEEKEIVDLSLGGISFVYVDNGKPLNKTFELEIKIGDDFHLGKVRVKIISDIEISEITSKSQIIKRLSARFINLNALQEYELRRILKKYGKEFNMG